MLYAPGLRWHEIKVYRWGFPCLDYSLEVLVSWSHSLSVYIAHPFILCCAPFTCWLISHVIVPTLMLMFLMPLGCYLLYLFGRSWLPWICMFRFRTLDWGGAFCGRPSLPFRAGWFVSVAVVPDLPFGSRDPSSAREHLCNYLVNRTFEFGCDIWFMWYVNIYHFLW